MATSMTRTPPARRAARAVPREPTSSPSVEVSQKLPNSKAMSILSKRSLKPFLAGTFLAAGVIGAAAPLLGLSSSLAIPATGIALRAGGLEIVGSLFGGALAALLLQNKAAKKQ